MIVAATCEDRAAEPRVAITPETAKKLAGLGATVKVETGAGSASGIPDREYEAAGATIAKTAGETLSTADVVLKVRRPSPAELAQMKKGALVIATMDPYGHEDALRAMAQAGVAAFAMELMPRITRAQVMDVLSSQANLAGYRAVIDAAAEYGRALPMMMTARRLGAVVTATDVRPAAKEQVESLGAKFIAVEDEEFKQAETAGGYAKEMSAAYKAKQAELVAAHIAKQDIVVTTALIPGRPAPRLVSSAMVASMRPGSVIIDLAVERGGNVEGAKFGETVVTGNGVKIVGHANVPGRIAASSSALYARNLFAFVETLVDKASKSLAVKWDDELVKATLLTRDGAIVHQSFKPKAAETTGDA